MNLLEPAGARTDRGLVLEITHHVHCHQILLWVRRWRPSTAQTTVHGGSA